MSRYRRSFQNPGLADQALQAATMTLVVLAPLALGANREWAWTLCVVWSALLGVVATVTLLWRRPIAWPRGSGLLLGLFLGVVGWAWIQGVAWTPVAWHHPVWNLSAQALAEPVPGRVSLSPDDGAVAMLRLCAYALVFILSFLAAGTPFLARRGLQWLTLAGVAYSAYGLWVYGAGSGSVLWFHSPGWVRDVRGTFINHNSFATWVGLCLLCALAMFFQSATFRRNPAYQLPLDAGARFEAFLVRCWRPLVAVLMTTAALLLSHSRGGFVGACAGGFVLLLCIQWRQPIRRGVSRAALAVAVAAIAVVFWLSSDVLMQRLDRSTADYQFRVDAYALTLEGISDNPVLGFGYGAFAESMRLYRNERLEGYFDKAHNTYLEAMFELGWPAALCLGLCLLVLAAWCVQGVRRVRQGWIYPATGLAATVLVGAHALVDFSLQIPAVAMTYAAIMGIACRQSCAESAPTPVVYTAAHSNAETGRPV